MATKNIGVREDVYEHLKAHKRGGESFSETIERLLGELEGDWRTHFGFLDEEAGEEFAEEVAAGRERLDEDLTDRQQAVIDALDDGTEE